MMAKRIIDAMPRSIVLLILITLLAACSGAGLGATASPSPSAGPSPLASATPTATATGMVASSGTASSGPGGTIEPSSNPGGSAEPTPLPSVPAIDQPALRYQLVDQLGRPLFCDPDIYPIARADEQTLAEQHLSGIQADAPTYAAITGHLGIDPAVVPTADQVLAIYGEWKTLRAIVLTQSGTSFGFDYIAADAGSTTSGWHVVGTVDAAGTVAVASRVASGMPPCPICLARGTRIATPSGERAVEDLTPGMLVWTSDEAGRRIIGVILQVGSTPVPPTHQVVHLVLSDGRTVDVSPGHRSSDGRPIGDLRPGDAIDGATVVSAELEDYAGRATFDLLPSGPTGTYWANGIHLASTLSPATEP